MVEEELREHFTATANVLAEVFMEVCVKQPDFSKTFANADANGVSEEDVEYLFGSERDLEWVRTLVFGLGTLAVARKHLPNFDELFSDLFSKIIVDQR